MNWKEQIKNKLKEQKNLQLWRNRTIVENNNTRFLTIKGKRYYNFSSNDYLGFSQNKKIIHAWKKGSLITGVGASASTHMIGYSYLHAELEKKIAKWLGYSRALLFNSGYSANQAVIQLLMKKSDCILADKRIHASFLEAAKNSQAKLYRFLHNDVNSLEKLIQKNNNTNNTLIITEGLFSMDGDYSPLKDIVKKIKNKEWLLVDDAHGIGIIGKQGRGSCFLQKVKPELQIITFGKAFGLSGAALLCDNDVADYFLQFSRHLIYSTAISPAHVYTLLKSLSMIKKSGSLRKKLYNNIHFFKNMLKKLPIKLYGYDSPIQPLIIGKKDKTIQLASILRSLDCWVTPILPPTVPEKTSRLRITITAAHKKKDILHLIKALHYATKF
ncbi:aminotransferase class I/II-fold pyridoxal phosphate-dependent enzyme [Candidatus Tachikawaea gelatinosa]|uniref:8-amino-7-oxononanoate synthase n=1 Tax=Candidatus Tachikawaea gelatinosa TaxID=1410383 RepID=A0A090AQK1_9ENTR|nr:8-amino-7-oxononanoate synthase [Candidatus Tachikawaea gelatinosa]BAP58622.1 8-amino-7-oxononanoate synthase [Candidatus Tachikawaea gelatinosa]